ncbi:CtsR family transcriptional regulator [Peptoniphilus sp. GNH]|nr:putative transcriptional regulator CtsR [Clostridiales bacterium KA00134]UHR03375.1 CtsR family transcriptional regulator [Peptoniphilus sp. GNH]
MARLTNSIADFIIDLLDAQGGSVEIQRNIIAQRFSCAPSQINYVLTTRFTPYKGYYVESRRGGGGFIRIVRAEISDSQMLKYILEDEIGDSLTKDKADEIIDNLLENDIIDKREAEIIRVGLSDRSICTDGTSRNIIRASILKNILLVIL